MGLAAFCASPRAGLAADAVMRICDRHHLVAHVIAKLVLTLKGLFDQFEHLSAAYLVASSAADAFVDVYRFNESRGPCLGTPRVSDDCHVIPPFDGDQGLGVRDWERQIPF